MLLVYVSSYLKKIRELLRVSESVWKLARDKFVTYFSENRFHLPGAPEMLLGLDPGDRDGELIPDQRHRACSRQGVPLS